ncbi:MAG TPA: AAA family ATPase, partial [Dehalococcoidia bacterium]|nr:AAA family ATPase [Dehalococcoidia bacterium]
MTELSRRMPFVGRDQELALLDARLAEARVGRGALVLLSGEPGIGKTRTAEELARCAGEAGMRVLWGRCWEGPGAPAFWPWVEALRPLLSAESAADVAAACAAIGPAAADLATVLPELRGRLRLAQSPPALDPDQARFRLFESVSLFLRALAARRPLLLVLDDLHWADTASLLLLQFFARDLSAVSLLLLGTYRDVEVDRDHPLGETLAALRRQPAFSRLSLGGLAPDAVLAVMRALAPLTEERVTSALARALHDDTEGNPFFIQEAVRHLRESGRELAGIDDLRGLGVPDGVREVIGRRVARLSPNCLQTLRVAAVIGREFSIAVLRAAMAAGETPIDDGSLAVALDEAEIASVVSAIPGAPGRYRFVHALMRETLYDELTSMRRLRLHRQVGRALAQRHADELDPHLAELAHHFAQAATLYPEDAAQAAWYAARAAERAGRLLAYEEAARHYELALRALELEGHGDAPRRCDLLLALGEAEARAGRNSQARQRFAQVAELARTLADWQRFAQAALGFGGPVVTVGVVDAPLVRLLEEALAALGQAECPLRARLLARLGMELLYSEAADAADRRDRLSAAAVTMARHSDDATALGFALNARHYAIWEPSTLSERLAAATEIVEIGEASGSADLAMQGRRWRI